MACDVYRLARNKYEDFDKKVSPEFVLSIFGESNVDPEKIVQNTAARRVHLYQAYLKAESEFGAYSYTSGSLIPKLTMLATFHAENLKRFESSVAVDLDTVDCMSMSQRLIREALHWNDTLARARGAMKQISDYESKYILRNA